MCVCVCVCRPISYKTNASKRCILRHIVRHTSLAGDIAGIWKYGNIGGILVEHDGNDFSL